MSLINNIATNSDINLIGQTLCGIMTDSSGWGTDSNTQAPIIPLTFDDELYDKWELNTDILPSSIEDSFLNGLTIKILYLSNNNIPINMSANLDNYGFLCFFDIDGIKFPVFPNVSGASSTIPNYIIEQGAVLTATLINKNYINYFPEDYVYYFSLLSESNYDYIWFLDLPLRDTTVQSKLVSGTNIKTINNQSLLGSGNLDISSGATVSPTTGTASKVTLGSPISVPNVTSVGTIPSITKNDITIKAVDTFAAGTTPPTVAMDGNTLVIGAGTAPSLSTTNQTATQITAWNAGTAPTLGSTLSIPNITSATDVSVVTGIS